MADTTVVASAASETAHVAEPLDTALPSPATENVATEAVAADGDGNRDAGAGTTFHVSSKDFVGQMGKHVEKWFTKMCSVPIQNFFKQKHWGYGFVTVLPSDGETFKNGIHGLIYKHHIVQVNDGAPKGEGKRKAGENGGGPPAKKAKGAFREGYVPTLKDLKERAKSRKISHAKEETVLQKSVPLFEYSYDTQLSMKGVYIKSTVRSFTKQVLKKCEDEARTNPPWTDRQWQRKAGAPYDCGCPLDDPIGTPLESLEGYRNKCEFTIGVTEAGERECGLVLRTLPDSSLQVASCQDAPHVPAPMKRLCKVVGDVVRASPFPVFDRKRGSKTGIWRSVMVRLSPVGEMLVLVQTATLGAEDKDRLLKPLVDALFPPSPPSDGALGVVSLYLQFNDEVTDAARPDDPLMHVHGKERIVMPLLGLKFEIGPLSFYQANTVTQELLYTRALDWLCPKPSAVVLDVCSGVGTIGLCAASRCRQVIGLELVPEAVESARQNAALNDIKNATFHVGKAEDTLPAVLAALGPDVDEVCAIVDPPRPGLHPSVLQLLRQCKRLTRIVYISCNPDSLAEDVVRLTAPSEMDDDPLYPTRAVAVDMFPHTLHCEMILQLERASRVQDPRSKTSEAELSPPAKPVDSGGSAAVDAKDGD